MCSHDAVAGKAASDDDDNKQRRGSSGSSAVACLTSDALQLVLLYVDVPQLLRHVVRVCRRWHDAALRDVHAWRLRWQQYVHDVFADHGLVQRLRLARHVTTTTTTTTHAVDGAAAPSVSCWPCHRCYTPWRVARGAAPARPLRAVTHTWPRHVTLTRMDITLVVDDSHHHHEGCHRSSSSKDSSNNDDADEGGVDALLARAAQDIVTHACEHAHTGMRRGIVSLSRAQQRWRLVRHALLLQPREARTLARLYARTLYTLTRTAASPSAHDTDDARGDNNNNSNNNSEQPLCAVVVRVGAASDNDDDDDGRVTQSRATSRLMALLCFSLSFSWRVCYAGQLTRHRDATRHHAGAEGAYAIDVVDNNSSNNNNNGDDDMHRAATLHTPPFASPIGDGEVFPLCVSLRRLRAWRYATRQAQRVSHTTGNDDDKVRSRCHGDGDSNACGRSDDADDVVRELLQRHCIVRATRMHDDDDDDNNNSDDDDDDTLVFAHPLHHVVCYVHLLLHTELTLVQHNCWPNEVKYAVYGRIVSPAGDVVETRFFYSYYDMAYPRMYATMLFARSALPHAQLARELRTRAQRGDDAVVRPYNNNSNNDDDDDGSVVCDEAIAGARHACIAALHAPMQLFCVGYGRVEVDKPPTVSAAALCALRDALGLPRHFALGLVWNSALHASGMAAGILRHHRDTLLELYKCTFTQAVSNACGVRACYGALSDTGAAAAASLSPPATTAQ